MSTEEQMDLAERISEPVIPQEVVKDIGILEQKFIRAEVEQLRQSILAFRPLYEQRTKIVSNPEVQASFWSRVLSNASADIDDHITPPDAAILHSALNNLTVERFEINEKGEGEPRSLRFTFEFHGEENPFFENEKLVKELYWRKQVLTTASGKKRTWNGLVSEPVRINWKKDMDVTKGLLDAACDLFEAEKKGGNRRELPEFKKLTDKLVEVEAIEEDEEDDEDPLGQISGQSFFNFFGYRGSDVTAEQSAAATKEEDAQFEKIIKGEKVEDDEADDDEDVDDDFDEIEISQDGEGLAHALAEDLWPNAMKYYVQSFEEGPEFDMDDLEDLEDDEDEDEDDHPRKKTKV